MTRVCLLLAALFLFGCTSTPEKENKNPPQQSTWEPVDFERP